jgi:hypothetical protein
MMFARIVFAVAALIGLGTLIPLYQAEGTETYYALVGTIAAWQALFLLIAWQPRRFRLGMIPAFLEKLFWVSTFVVFYVRGTVTAIDLAGAIWLQGALAVLFVVAFYQTRGETARAPDA